MEKRVTHCGAGDLALQEARDPAVLKAEGLQSLPGNSRGVKAADFGDHPGLQAGVQTPFNTALELREGAGNAQIQRLIW